MATHNAMSPNQREGLSAVSSITGKNEYVFSTNHSLNSTATIAGSAIPISGATTAVAVGIVDGSGNQITSFGGGTQYTDGGVPPTHPIGGTIEWSDGSNWQTVSTAKPLPVSATFSPSGTQDTNLKQINGNTTLVGNGVTGTGSQRVTIASDNTAFAVNATLSAETTKVIGVTRTADGSGNLITSTGNALDINIKSGNPTSIAVTQTTSPWVVAGGVTSGSTDSQAPVKGAGKYNSTKPTFSDGQVGDLQLGTRGSLVTQIASADGTTAATVIAPADDQANQNGLYATSATMVWDPGDGNWDRIRAINATLNTAAPDSGIISAGLVAQFDDVAPTAITENQFGNLRISANRNAYTTIRDAAGNERGVNVDANNNLQIGQATAANLNATIVGTKTNNNATPGTNNIGALVGLANAVAPTYTEGDQVLLSTDLSGNVRITGIVLAAQTGTYTSNLSPAAVGGWKGYSFGNTTNAALTTTQTVSGSAGKYGGYTLINLNSSPAYIQIFDTTGAVTLGTTAPNYIITIPANSTAANGVGANFEMANGLVIASGIKVAATTTSNGASTVATGITGTFLYF